VSKRPFLPRLPRNLIQPNFVRVILLFSEGVRFSQSCPESFLAFWRCNIPAFALAQIEHTRNYFGGLLAPMGLEFHLSGGFLLESYRDLIVWDKDVFSFMAL
jgi:hypothetical protein